MIVCQGPEKIVKTIKMVSFVGQREAWRDQSERHWIPDVGQDRGENDEMEVGLPFENPDVANVGDQSQ